MKHNFKKIMSLLLTVVMLLGTVSAVIPFSASAESVPNQNVNVNVNQDGTVTIEPNTDAVYNGVTYRFDVKDGNTDSVAKINADGTVTVTFRYGDMLWFPEVKTDADALVHAEVTALGRGNTTGAGNSMGELFFGFGYGIKEDTDGSWASGYSAVMRTIGRTRIVPISPSLVTALQESGKNFGHAGTSHVVNPSDELNSESATFSQWDYIAYGNDNKTWTMGSAWLLNLTLKSAEVAGEWGSYCGVYNKTTYTTQTKTTNCTLDWNENSLHHMGSVGILPIWMNNDDYITVRLDSLTVDSVSVLNRKQLSGNTLWNVNGVSMRMDYISSSHAGSGLTVNADGTLTIRGQRGDMFWMPNVEIDSTSTISTSVVMDYAINQEKASAGTIFNVQATNGAWDDNADTAMIAALRPYNGNARRSIGAINFYTATEQADYTKVLSEVNYTPTNTNFGNTWAVGAMVKTTISQNAETGEVTAVFKDSNGDDIIDAKYTDVEYPFAGPVGYMTHWSGSDYVGNSIGYYIYTIKEYKITNAIVNGVKVAEFDLIDELAKYMSEENTYTLRSSLSLNGVIGLNVRVDANYFIKGTETLVVTDKASETVVETTLADIWNTDGGYYACTIPVNAKEMTDTFTVTLKDGEAVIATYSNLSVKSYAEALKANDDWKNLMTAMLNYGAAAQNLFDYNTENPAAYLTNFDFDMKDVEGNDIGLPTITGTDNTIISDLSASLVLESDTALKLYFKNETDADLTVTVDNETAELTKANDGLLCLTISDIAADELAKEFVVSINEGALVITISACEWAKTVVENETDADMVTLAKALAAYATAAASKN